MVASHAKVSEGQVGVSMCSESVCEILIMVLVVLVYEVVVVVVMVVIVVMGIYRIRKQGQSLCLLVV